MGWSGEPPPQMAAWDAWYADACGVKGVPKPPESEDPVILLQRRPGKWPRSERVSSFTWVDGMRWHPIPDGWQDTESGGGSDD